MFKFSIVNNTNQNTNNFYNGSAELGIKDMYRFLTWFDLTEIDLPIPELHLLLRDGAVGDFTLTISECENVSEFLAEG